ncbi:MAG: fumarate reductase subunit C [Nitrospirae bacterium]|nr:fumarate reductase subunit C [Nitrospirota bacterium]
MKAATPSAEITKTYRRNIPNTWWLKRASYFFFMLRELSSVFVAIFAIFLLLQIKAVASGPEGYADWLACVQSPGTMALLGISLVFVVYHLATWFRISGRIFGYGSLSPAAVVAANYIVWLVVTVGVYLVILRG